MSFFLHDARCNIPASLPTYLLGPPVRELTHAATAYLDVGLTSDPRPRHRHQPADLSNGPPLFLWPMELSPLNWNMAAKHTEASQLGSRKKSEWHNEPRLIRVRFICRPPVCLTACLPACCLNALAGVAARISVWNIFQCNRRFPFLREINN